MGNTLTVSGSALVGLILLFAPRPAGADLALGPEVLVSADGEVLVVPGYSVPSFVAWDGDALPDLIVGEGGGAFPEGKIRVYRNVGTPGAPVFGSFAYVESEGSPLVLPGGG